MASEICLVLLVFFSLVLAFVSGSKVESSLPRDVLKWKTLLMLKYGNIRYI
jgi:hypothetical protein